MNNLRIVYLLFLMFCLRFSFIVFTENEFYKFISQLQGPSICLGVLSLTWELVVALLK